MNKLSALLLAAMLPFCSFALDENEEDIAVPPYITVGTLYYMKVIAGTNIVRIPDRVTYVEGTGGTSPVLLWTITQTHTFLGGNMAQLPTPVGIYSISHGSFAQNRSFQFAYQWWVYLTASGRTNAQKYGKFRLELKVQTSSGTQLYIKTWDWEWTPYYEGYYSEGDLNNPPGGITPGDLNEQPINQGGFWSNLFVPSEVSIQDFKTTTGKWSTWGPFGIYNAVTGAFQTSNNVSEEFREGYVLDFAGFDMDLSPYEIFIKFARVLMAGTLWYIALFGFWRSVIQKA